MSYRRTKQLTAEVKQPEDNWDLIGNPTIYLDELPQPYKFVN